MDNNGQEWTTICGATCISDAIFSMLNILKYEAGTKTNARRLMQIVDLDEKNQILTSNMWLSNIHDEIYKWFS